MKEKNERVQHTYTDTKHVPTISAAEKKNDTRTSYSKNVRCVCLRFPIFFFIQKREESEMNWFDLITIMYACRLVFYK